jgi:hypothetical protein
MCYKILAVVTLFLVGVSNSISYSQNTTDREVVTEVISTLFKAMELGDSAMAHKTFSKQVTTATIFKDKSGNPVLRREDSIDGFLKAIGTAHKETWYEEIWNLEVSIDGDLAQAWCDYAFYIDNNFSHCGVDAFHLFREDDVWKIFHLADTRRKNGCEIPTEIKKKHQ